MRAAIGGTANSNFPSVLDFDDPNLAFTRAHAVPPPSFQIGFSSDKSTLIFILKATDAPGRGPATTGFRVYFAPISLASPAQMANPNIAYNVWNNQATLIASESAQNNGGETRISDTIHATIDGWFFATATNLFGRESRFVGPQRNPIIGTNDERVPDDVFDQDATLADGGLDPWGRQLVEVTVTAKVPMQSPGISNVQVTAGGSGYTSAPTVSFSGGGGSGAQAVAKLNGDQVFEVDMVAAGSGYTSTPTVVFTGGGGTGADASAFLTTTGSFAGYQIYLGNYFGAGIIVEGPVIWNGGNVPGTTLRGKFLLYQDTPPAHSVVLYFVAISQTGTRTDNPAGAPSVTFAGGIEP